MCSAVIYLTFAIFVCGCTQQQNPKTNNEDSKVTGKKEEPQTKTPGGIKPFLSLPFKEGTKLEITEGWFYSDEEKAIHGYEKHYGVDFATDRGTPVLATADGFALSSFHSAWANKTYKDEKVGFGLGRFVQIWHPEAKVYTMYGHLERIENGIPYYEPVKQGDMWNPTVVNQSVEAMLKKVKPVKRGDVIGYVGDTGLAWGYEETPTMRPDPKQFPSWDETHLHFEVYDRDEQGRKKNRYDPFDLYGQAQAYQAMPARGLWLFGKNSQPQFAK